MRFSTKLTLMDLTQSFCKYSIRKLSNYFANPLYSKQRRIHREVLGHPEQID